MNNIFTQNNNPQDLINQNGKKSLIVVSAKKLNRRQEFKNEDEKNITTIPLKNKISYTKRMPQSTHLYIPKDQQHISTASGHSVISCPSDLSINTPTKTTNTLNEANKLTVKNENSCFRFSTNSSTFINDKMEWRSVNTVKKNSQNSEVRCASESTLRKDLKQKICVEKTSNIESEPILNNSVSSIKPLCLFGEHLLSKNTEKDFNVKRRRCSAVQIGAPAIAFRSIHSAQQTRGGKRLFERRSSQPIISVNLASCNHCFHTPQMFLKRINATGTAAPFTSTNNGAYNIGISPLVRINHSNETSEVALNTGPNGVFSNHALNNSGQRFYYPSGANNNQNSNILKDDDEMTSLDAQQASLAKRVSWLSFKSLQDAMEPLLDINQKRHRESSECPGISGNANVINGPLGGAYDSRTNSQLGSIVQLNDFESYDLEADTPPIDTMSWSNMGKK